VCASFAGIGNVKIPILKNEGSGTRKINATSPGSARRFLGGRSLSSDIKAGRSLVGRGFQPRHNKPARGAFRSRCLSRETSILGSPLPFERHGRFPTAARRSCVFAFRSQRTPNSAEIYSTLHVERNASQVIENNQRGYALLDTILRTRRARNREGKINEDPPLHKPQGWGTRKDKGNDERKEEDRSRSLTLRALRARLRMTRKERADGARFWGWRCRGRNGNQKEPAGRRRYEPHHCGRRVCNKETN
jgi:hypothetical protein